MRIGLMLLVLAACKDDPDPAGKPRRATEAVEGAELDRAKAQTERAEKAAREARLVAEQAQRDAEEAAAAVTRLQTDLDDLDTKLTAVVDALAAAQNDADRAAAKAKLEALRREKAEIEARVAAARASAAKARRVQGAKISKECMDNPLAKGCM